MAPVRFHHKFSFLFGSKKNYLFDFSTFVSFRFRRWPQPSKMKVSENSELGYEFPVDYLEWDRMQLNKILQRTIFKNPIWIGK